MKTKNINIGSYINGRIASGRQTGNRIKNDFLKYYEMGIKIDLDFNGIDGVTHSFVDELIGAFIFYDAKRALDILKFSNCNDDVKSVIKFVIADRISNKVAA